MENKHSTVSILIPTYNGALYIQRAIQSVLSQTYTDWEMIIIDDCSTDNTAQVITDFLNTLDDETLRHKITFLQNAKNLGVQKTRNVALEKVRGMYVAEIDQDDEWIVVDKLAKQIVFLEAHKDYVLVGAGVVIVDEHGKEITRYLMPVGDKNIRGRILRMNCFIHSSVVYRFNALSSAGTYNPNKLSEDHDLWLRLGRVGLFTNMPIYAVQYTLHSGGFNSQNKLFRLRQNMEFIREHKDFYPNAFWATVTGWAKILFTPFFKIMPTWLKGFFLNLHKKI